MTADVPLDNIKVRDSIYAYILLKTLSIQVESVVQNDLTRSRFLDCSNCDLNLNSSCLKLIADQSVKMR